MLNFINLLFYSIACWIVVIHIFNSVIYLSDYWWIRALLKLAPKNVIAQTPINFFFFFLTTVHMRELAIASWSWSRASRLYQRFHAGKKNVVQQSVAPGFCSLIWMPVHTRKIIYQTRSNLLLELTVSFFDQVNMREQNPVAQHFFRVKSLLQTRNIFSGNTWTLYMRIG